ncbi:platelet endothelial cell adhesion molecule [Aulostomus maculatus]
MELTHRKTHSTSDFLKASLPFPLFLASVRGVASSSSHSGEPASLRMDPRPPNLLLLLLTSLPHLLFTIDQVGLTILPRSTVESGIRVTLRCDVIVSHDNTIELTHTFKFTRDDIPVHSSTTTEDFAVYELDPARAADSGSYECRVTVHNKSKSSYTQKLNVTGLQTPTLHLNKTTFFEGEEFMATCSAPQEKGSLIFHFYQKSRSGEHREIKKVATTGNSSETKLVLRQVGDSHLYCDYENTLVSGSRRSNRSNEIQVIVKGLYISPVMNVLPSAKVYEGDVIEVVCKVVSPPRNIEVFLTKDRRILKRAPVSLSHRFTAKEGDSGELVCKAEWENVQKETYQTITVKSLFSQPHLTMEPRDVFERESFTLTCSVDIYVPERIDNQSMSFSIYKDNVKIASAETYTSVANSSTNGNYTCKVKASSPTHTFFKESQIHPVEAKVPVSEPMMSVVGGTLVIGKRFQVLCHSNSGTLPIYYTLYGPDRPSELRVVSHPGERAIFNTTPIYKRSDINKLLCHAKNNKSKPPMIRSGQQLLHSTKIIEPVSKPVMTMHPSTGDVSEGEDLTLVCFVHSGTPPISFTWYRSEKEEELFSQNSDNLKGSFSIDNVRGKHRGSYYCVSTNQANETKRSNTVVVGVKLAGWKKGLIALFCILFILALILVIVFRKRLIRFKNKRTGHLSVKSVGTKPERLSLTQAEVNETANATPGMMGKSIWSEHVSGSESDDQNSVVTPDNHYTEVQTRQVDPNKVPVNKGTEPVNSEVRNSKQALLQQPDCQGSVEYAQLNRDTDHHDNHSIPDDHLDEIDNSADMDAADHDE